MTDQADTPEPRRELWIRGLYMLVMVFAFHLSWTVMLVIAVIQFIMAALSKGSNDRLISFGRNLGRYLQQIASFLTFASEEIPFPFSDWPAGE